MDYKLLVFDNGMTSVIANIFEDVKCLVQLERFVCNSWYLFHHNLIRRACQSLFERLRNPMFAIASFQWQSSR